MEKINVAQLIKDCPKGMELDCTICNNVVTLEGVDKEGYYPIRVMTKSGYHHRLTCEGYVYEEEDAKCVIYPKGKTTWEGFVSPCKFKDGDVCCVRTEEFKYIFIFKVSEDYKYIQNYACLSENNLYTGKDPVCTTDCVHEIRLATEEEKQKLFQAINDNGFRWNDETKTLEKLVPNKFDITTLVPFESKVLVRDMKSHKWKPAIWGFYDEESLDYRNRVVGGYIYRYCIPYVGNERLLGTNNDCDEFYKTWEE